MLFRGLPIMKGSFTEIPNAIVRVLVTQFLQICVSVIFRSGSETILHRIKYTQKLTLSVNFANAPGGGAAPIILKWVDSSSNEHSQRLSKSFFMCIWLIPYNPIIQRLWDSRAAQSNSVTSQRSEADQTSRCCLFSEMLASSPSHV